MEKKLATALLAACLLGTVGCHAFKSPDVDRLGRTRGEYVLDDGSAESTWSQAASESLREDETRFSAMKPIDASSTSPEESKEPDESFAEKLADVFHASKTSSAKDDGYYERSQVAERAGSVAGQKRTSRGATQPSSSDAPKTQSSEPGFWSKLFPSKQTARQEHADDASAQRSPRLGR
ncbi:MAG: hypothetical protein J6X44_01320, partial [Thermoguttaceae bacterium]|nr:hypothetical protein [Thermoguttaceae bacterium]